MAKTTEEKLLKVHMLIVESESGDSYGPFLFRKMPSDQELFDFLSAQCPGELNAARMEHQGEACDEFGLSYGPGWKGSYLHLTWGLEVVR